MEGMLRSDQALRLVEDDIPAEAEHEWVGIDSLNQFLTVIGRYPRLTPAEEVQLAKRIERGDEDARQRMIESNLRLVVAIAKEHRSRSVPFLDVIQEGMPGLIRAVDKFDWRLGNRFSTYASWWIHQSIRQALADNGRLIRVPAKVAGHLRAVERIERSLTVELGRRPSDNEVAAEAGLSREQLNAIRSAGVSTATISLDAPPASGERSLLELVPDPSAPEPLAELQLPEAAVTAALQDLSPRARRVLELRYGLNGHEPWSFEAIGRELDLSTARVREIETRALLELRRREEKTRILESAR